MKKVLKFILIFSNLFMFTSFVAHADNQYIVKYENSDGTYDIGRYKLTYYNAYTLNDQFVGSAFCLTPGKVSASYRAHTVTAKIDPTKTTNKNLKAYYTALQVAYQEMASQGYFTDGSKIGSRRAIGSLLFREISYKYGYLDTSLANASKEAELAPYITEQGIYDNYHWPADCSEVRCQRVRVARQIYSKAIAAGDRIKKSANPDKTYESLIKEKTILKDNWSFELLSTVNNEQTKHLILTLNMKAASNINLINWQDFEADCSYGYSCEIIKKEPSSDKKSAKLTIDVNTANGKSNSSAAGASMYGLSITTSFTDVRYLANHMYLLSPPNPSSNQEMLLVRTDNASNIINTDISVELDGCVCEVKNNKYTGNYVYTKYNKNGTPQKTIFKANQTQQIESHNCPDTCLNWDDIPDCEIKDGQYYGLRQYHPDGIPVDKNTYREECLHSCEKPTNSNPNYYCKESEPGKGDGEVCDEKQYIKDCQCPSLKTQCDNNPNSDSCTQYDDLCTDCSPTISLPSDCLDFDTESTYTGIVSDINEIETDCNPKTNEIKRCVVNHTDLAGNSFKSTSEISKNSYCSVWCKEKYQFTVPTAQYSQSGGYFLLSSKINGQRDCYIGGSAGFEKEAEEIIKLEPTINVSLSANAQNIINNVKKSWPTNLELERINLIYKAASLLDKGVGYSQNNRSSASNPNPTYLDCSSYVNWAFWQIGHTELEAGAYTGTFLTSPYYTRINENELRPGDVGLNNNSLNGGNSNHIGIYIGKNTNGERIFLNSTTWNNGYYASMGGNQEPYRSLRGPQWSPLNESGERKLGYVRFQLFYRFTNFSPQLNITKTEKVSIADSEGINTELFEYDFATAKAAVASAYQSYLDELSKVVEDETEVQRQSRISSSLSTLQSANSRVTSVINEYNKCTSGWTNNMNYNPKIKFTYTEDYMSLLKNNEFEKKSQTKTIQNTYCLGDVNNNYECEAKNKITSSSDNSYPSNLYKEVKYSTCNADGCTEHTAKVSKAKYIQKTKIYKGNFSPNFKFSTYNQYGTIKTKVPECNGNDCVYTNLPENAIPVSLKTKSGVFPFKFTFENIGQNNKNRSKLGRLIGDSNSILVNYQKSSTKCTVNNNNKKLDTSIDGSYVCHYINNCDDCDYTCTEKNGKFYDKNGNSVGKDVYLAQCFPDNISTCVCEVDENNKYTGNYKYTHIENGAIVASVFPITDTAQAQRYNCTAKCQTNTKGPKCTEANGKYYDDDGNSVDRETYLNRCFPNCTCEFDLSNKHTGNYKYTYVENGNILSTTFPITDTEKAQRYNCLATCDADTKGPKCTEENGNYYDKNGNSTSYEDYLEKCFDNCPNGDCTSTCTDGDCSSTDDPGDDPGDNPGDNPGGDPGDNPGGDPGNNCPNGNCNVTCPDGNCSTTDNPSDEVCKNGECTFTCKNCIFDGNQSLFEYRSVSLNNLFPNSCDNNSSGCREEGYNWKDTEKAKKTKEEIENNAENIYNEPEYSYTLSASQLQNIRNCNKKIGSFNNPYNCEGTTAIRCEHITIDGIEYSVKCTSTFLDDNTGKYFTENKRNEEFQLWTETNYCSNGSCLSRKDGIGPSWK